MGKKVTKFGVDSYEMESRVRNHETDLGATSDITIFDIA